MINILSYDWITQAIGIIASGFIILSFGQKRDLRLKYFLMTGNVLFAIHFGMMGAYAGLAVNILNFLRVWMSIKFHKSTRMMLLFMCLSIATGFAVYQNYYDILPIISSVMGSYSLFKLSGIPLRIFGIIGSINWLTYSFIIKSIGGIMTDTVALVINFSTIYRLKRDKKKVALYETQH